MPRLQTEIRGEKYPKSLPDAGKEFGLDATSENTVYASSQ